MTLPYDTVMELMAYADGELSGDDLVRVEALLARSDEARRVVAAIESPAIGAWLEASTNERAVSAKADGIADAVMLQVAAETSAAHASKVVPLRRRNTAFAVAAGVLALAAAVLLWVRSQPSTQPSTQPLVAELATGHTTQTAPAPSAPVDTSEGIEVNEVEAPARDVSVYYLDPTPSSALPSTNSVVIWIGDDSKKPGGGK